MKPTSHSSPDRIPAPKFRWGTRVAIPVGILVAFVALFASSLAKTLTPVIEVTATPVVERPAILRTVFVTSSKENGEVIAQAAGWIEPEPFTVYATALTNGSVELVEFLEGDIVSKGDVLASLVDDDAQLALHRSEAEARAAEEAWESNIEAQRAVSISAASVRESEATLELARAELEIEQALSRDAERIYTRRKTLVSDGTIAQESYETAEAASLAQSARVKVVRSRIHELEAKVDRMKAEETAAKKRFELRTEERRRLDLARVDLAEAQLRLDRMKISSPIDGVVMRRLVEPGSMLMTVSDNPQMSRVAELYDPEKLQVRVDVPLAEVAKIGVGQPAQVVIEILPERTFTGTVSRITNLADIQKNTLEVKVSLEEPAPELKPDMLARVRFLSLSQSNNSQETASGLSVFAPASSIKNGSAWVVTQFDGESGIAMQRSVSTTGATEGDWQEIESGLLPGDIVITSSAENLQPQQQVQVHQEGNP